MTSKNFFSPAMTIRTRISVLTGMALIATGFALSTPVRAADAMELVIVTWGGAYEAAQQKSHFDPYMAANPNIKIMNDESGTGSVAKLRAQNETGKVTWDVIDAIIADAVRMCDDGLLETVNPDKDLAPAPDGTPASKDFEGYLLSECFIPQLTYSTTFAYRTDLEQKPEELCDIFDLEKIPGKRSLEKRPLNNLEWALLCDGVASDEIYDVLATDEGVEQAFAKLDTIKDQIIWWTQGAQPAQLLADKEVVISSGWNGRLFDVIEKEKQPVAMLWDWQILDIGGWVIPKGAPNPKEAKKFIRWATEAQSLADLAKYISYGPTRASAMDLVGKHAELGIDMSPHMPTHPDNVKRSLVYNYEFWADNRDNLDQRFDAWLLK